MENINKAPSSSVDKMVTTVDAYTDAAATTKDASHSASQKFVRAPVFTFDGGEFQWFQPLPKRVSAGQILSYKYGLHRLLSGPTGSRFENDEYELIDTLDGLWQKLNDNPSYLKSPGMLRVLEFSRCNEFTSNFIQRLSPAEADFTKFLHNGLYTPLTIGGFKSGVKLCGTSGSTTPARSIISVAFPTASSEKIGCETQDSCDLASFCGVKMEGAPIFKWGSISGYENVTPSTELYAHQAFVYGVEAGTVAVFWPKSLSQQHPILRPSDMPREGYIRCFVRIVINILQMQDRALQEYLERLSVIAGSRYPLSQSQWGDYLNLYMLIMIKRKQIAVLKELANMAQKIGEQMELSIFLSGDYAEIVPRISWVDYSDYGEMGDVVKIISNELGNQQHILEEMEKAHSTIGGKTGTTQWEMIHLLYGIRYR